MSIVSICFNNYKFKGMSNLPCLNSTFKTTVFIMCICTTLITTLEYMESHIYFELLVCQQTSFFHPGSLGKISVYMTGVTILSFICSLNLLIKFPLVLF